MINWGHPDWRLIVAHKDFVLTWAGTTINSIIAAYEKGGILEPHMYTAGYNYATRTYQRSVNPVKLSINQTPLEKFELYEWMNNIELYLPYQPLSLILSSHMILESSKEGTIPCIIIWFQTRLYRRRYIYRLDAGRMVIDHDLSNMRLGEEIELFDAVFVLGHSVN